MRNIGREMKHPVRVMLLEMPQLLRDIFEHAIEQRGDCEVLKDGNGVHRQAVSDPSPDIVVLGLGAIEDTKLVPALLTRWPHAQIVTVMATGDQATAYEVTTRRRAIDQMTPEKIMQRVCTLVYRKRKITRGVA